MESNPDEFYGDASKWNFMFAANFRDVMTEPEKGALHEGLKNVRRKEFDELVMRRILRDEENEKMEQMRASATGIIAAPWRQQMVSTTQTGQGLLSGMSANYNPALNSVNPYK
jgi:hypothetical protein